MTLDAQTAGIIAIVAGVLALVALVVIFVLSAQISGMRRDYTLLQDHDGKESFVGVVARKTEEVGLLREQVELLHAELVHTREELSAFGDMGGRMSFTAAMVDDHGDGVVLTTIHARAESRTYIRALRRGEADSTLSPEENQAVEQVMGDLR